MREPAPIASVLNTLVSGARPWRSPRRDSRAPRVVELVGLPGVGKSFLSRCIDERVRDAPDGVVRTTFEGGDRPLHASRLLLGKVARAFRFTLREPRTVTALARAVRADADRLGYRRLTKLVNLLSELERTARVPAASTLISEQGVLQAIWSLEMLARGSIADVLLARAAAWLPDAVVRVDVDPQRYEQRLRGRKDGRSRFDGLPPERLAAEVVTGAARLSAILDAWALAVPAGQRLDCENDADRGAEVILAWLDGLSAV